MGKQRLKLPLNKSNVCLQHFCSRKVDQAQPQAHMNIKTQIHKWKFSVYILFRPHSG